jgi:hypothetical protein
MFNMRSLITFAAIIQACWMTYGVLARPDGAPACVIRPNNIAKMGGQDTDLGYRIQPSTTTFTVGTPLEITIKGNAPYKGLLMYVEGSKNSKLRLGNFEIPNGFKSNADKCDADLVYNQFSVITHASPALKQANTAFTWVPDLCENGIIRAVIVGDSKEKWQILKPVEIKCASSNNSTLPKSDTTPVSSPSPTPAPAPVPVPAPAPTKPAPIKCKRRKCCRRRRRRPLLPDTSPFVPSENNSGSGLDLSQTNSTTSPMPTNSSDMVVDVYTSKPASDASNNDANRTIDTTVSPCPSPQ